MTQETMAPKEEFTPEQETNENTRAFALNALVISLNPLLQSDAPFSETQLRNAWLGNLEKNPDIFPDGWYIPPAHGIGVLIGNATQKSRTNYDNLRKFETKDGSFFNAEYPVMYVYASPVDRKTGIIGDAGLTLYNGTDPTVQQHLKTCFDINKLVATRVEVGITFSDVYNLTMRLAEEHGLINEVVSITDPRGANIGHTIPPGFAQWSKKEQEIVAKGTWQEILDIIRRKRLYVNGYEKTKLAPGTSITIEPRLNSIPDPNLPQASFHTTLQVGKNGKVRLLTDFDELFKLFGMDYMV